MKVVLQDGRRHVLRFDKGESVLAELVNYCKSNQIFAAHFTGIGSVSEVKLGYYNQFLKEYRSKPYVENFEVLSLTGNISMLGAEPTVHAHGDFGRTDFTVIGGHVFGMTVLATCEIFLIKLEGKMERKENSDLKLNLLE